MYIYLKAVVFWAISRCSVAVGNQHLSNTLLFYLFVSVKSRFAILNTFSSRLDISIQEIK